MTKLVQTLLISLIQRNEIDQDYRENFREMDRLYGDNAQMKAKIEQLEDENKNLEAGLKEVMEAMKKYPGVPEGEGMEKGEREVMAMQFPTLERMLAVSIHQPVLAVPRENLSLVFPTRSDTNWTV